MRKLVIFAAMALIIGVGSVEAQAHVGDGDNSCGDSPKKHAHCILKNTGKLHMHDCQSDGSWEKIMC